MIITKALNSVHNLLSKAWTESRDVVYPGLGLALGL